MAISVQIFRIRR